MILEPGKFPRSLIKEKMSKSLRKVKIGGIFDIFHCSNFTVFILLFLVFSLARKQKIISHCIKKNPGKKEEYVSPFLHSTSHIQCYFIYGQFHCSQFPLLFAYLTLQTAAEKSLVKLGHGFAIPQNLANTVIIVYNILKNSFLFRFDSARFEIQQITIHATSTQNT